MSYDTRKWAQTFRALLPQDLWGDPEFPKAKNGGAEMLLAYVEAKARQTADDAAAFEAASPKLDRLNRRIGGVYGGRDALRWRAEELGLSLPEDDLDELDWFREELAGLRSREAALRELARAVRTDTPRRWTWSGSLVPDRPITEHVEGGGS